MNQMIHKILVTGILLLLGLGSSLALSSCGATEEVAGPSYQARFASNEVAFSDLLNMQQQVYDAFVQSLLTNTHQPLDALLLELEKMSQANQQNIVRYWQSYLQYYSAIYHSTKGDKEKAEKAIEAAVDRLEDLSGKNAEDYALLSLTQSFSIQFQSTIKAVIMSSRVKSNGEKALAMDPKNLRAYFVLGSNDYYTPAKYGGGTKVETYLLKALEQADQAVENPYLPSWGRAEAYEMLIKFYIKKEKWSDAKTHYQDALQHFPDNYQLSKLGSKLVGK
ncbi:MAG: hypothetical protein AAF206_04900 [Bacteroidota bacterium]